MSTELPEGWAEAKLGDVVSKLVDGSHSPPPKQTNGLPMLSAQNVTNGSISFADFRRITKDDFSHEHARTRITAGDVLLTIVGSIGRSAIVQHGSVPFTLQRSVAVISSPALLPGFLGYQLRAPRAQYYLAGNSRGTAQKGIYLNAVADLPIRAAPIAEQSRIVSKLDELFGRIDDGERALKRASKLVERYRQSVLKAAVTGELTREWREQHKGELESGEELLHRILKARREAWVKAGNDPKKYKEPSPPDSTGLPELPEGWLWASAEQLCAFITKGTTPPSEQMTAGSGEVPYIKVYNLTFDGSLDFTINPTFISQQAHGSDLRRSRLIPGDVLMNIVGPPLGKVSIVPDSYPEWNMNQAVCVFRPFQGYEKRLLAGYLLSDYAREWYSKRWKATVGQVNLTLEICRATPVPVPSHAEQLRIIQLIATSGSESRNVESVLAELEMGSSSLRQSILKAAFSGRLVPQDPNDEPASVLLERIAAERAAASRAPERRGVALRSGAAASRKAARKSDSSSALQPKRRSGRM